MELRHLRYFLGVAEAKNFTKAARSLHVAQPALSRQIRQLEDEVGVALFARGHEGARLTPAGEAFLAEARTVLEQSARAIQAARKTAPERAGLVNLGYVWGLFHSQVPAWVSRFRQRYPEVAVNLFDLTATQQAEAIAQGRIDAGFIGFPQEAAEARLSIRRVGCCDFVAALPSQHPAARRRIVPLALLAHDFFFTISEQHYPGASRFVLEACRQAGFRPKILQAAERGHTILSLVAGQCGVALLPEPLRSLPHPGVTFRPLANPPRGDLVVAWKPGRSSPARDAFLGMLGTKQAGH